MIRKMLFNSYTTLFSCLVWTSKLILCLCFKTVCLTFNVTKEKGFGMKTNQCVLANVTLFQIMRLGALEYKLPKIQ